MYIIKCEWNSGKNKCAQISSFYQAGAVCYCFYNCCCILLLCVECVRDCVYRWILHSIRYSFLFVSYFIHTHTHILCSWNFAHVSCVYSHFDTLSLPDSFLCVYVSIYVWHYLVFVSSVISQPTQCWVFTTTDKNELWLK